MSYRACSAAVLSLAFLVLRVSLASPAAVIPTDPQVSLPHQINLMGLNSGVVDPFGEFSVIVRDFVGFPIEGVTVWLYFDRCSDLRIGAIQPFPGIEVSCTNTVGTVWAVTDASGTATFRIVGGARNYSGGSPGAGFGCADVYVDDCVVCHYFAGRVNVGAFDENGASGVNPADISVWLRDSFAPHFVGRSDFDGSHSITPADLSLILSVSLAGGSSTSAPSYCH